MRLVCTAVVKKVRPTGWIGALGLVYLVVSLLAQAAPNDSIPQTIEFNRDIRPILSDKCYTCHGPSKQMKALRFDREEVAKHALADGRFAIVPGDPAESLLIQRVTATNPAVRMPMGGEALSARQIELIRRWIEQGAVWQQFWAFIPPKRPQMPNVKDTTWAHNAIDFFVLARLEQEGLKPSPPAEKTTLLRRVTFDLTGLPPTTAEVDAFLADKSPNAYEKVVDRLLASPRYGERMAFPWLEAARYADTNGYQTDAERSMWRWRDWVLTHSIITSRSISSQSNNWRAICCPTRPSTSVSRRASTVIIAATQRAESFRRNIRSSTSWTARRRPAQCLWV